MIYSTLSVPLLRCPTLCEFPYTLTPFVSHSVCFPVPYICLSPCHSVCHSMRVPLRVQILASLFMRPTSCELPSCILQSLCVLLLRVFPLHVFYSLECPHLLVANQGCEPRIVQASQVISIIVRNAYIRKRCDLVVGSSSSCRLAQVTVQYVCMYHHQIVSYTVLKIRNACSTSTSVHTYICSSGLHTEYG